MSFNMTSMYNHLRPSMYDQYAPEIQKLSRKQLEDEYRKTLRFCDLWANEYDELYEKNVRLKLQLQNMGMEPCTKKTEIESTGEAKAKVIKLEFSAMHKT